MIRHAVGLFLALGTALSAAEPIVPGQVESCIRVECRGRLRHGVVARGGETTGTTVTFDRVTWELKLPDEASRAFAALHHKEPIVVIGSLKQIAGTEIPARWIVDVERISKWDARSQKDGATVTVLGNLRAEDEKAAETAQMTVEANGTIWPLDLSADETLPARARSFLSKKVVVNGLIERAPESKVPLRMIIRVLKLDPPMDHTSRD